MSFVALTPAGLLALLADIGIAAETVDHHPVFTVAEARGLWGDLPGGHCKSLFLRNKKGRMWLVTTMAEQAIDLRDLGDRIGAGRVSFGSEERLRRHLGVVPGAVTPFGLANDPDGKVRVVLDERLFEHDRLWFHPLDNARSTAVSPAGLMQFLEAVGHAPLIVRIP